VIANTFLRGRALGVWLGTVAPVLVVGCGTSQSESLADLPSEIESVAGESGGEVAVYYRDLENGDSLLMNADLRMHAASTMKVPVMIQLYKDHLAGLINLEDSLQVTTTFHSIVDGSPYQLDSESDSETSLYAREGEWVGYRDLIESMITVSSNLATNLLIAQVGGDRVTESMRELGADSIQVLRGVEDIPAFEAGLSNTTTARDLGTILTALARGQAASPEASAEMLDIMARQRFRTKIPALLPEGTRVAHKTGSITGISHDAGVVFPDDAPPYVVVILTRGFSDPQGAESVAARISLMIFDAHKDRHIP